MNKSNLENKCSTLDQKRRKKYGFRATGANREKFYFYYPFENEDGIDELLGLVLADDETRYMDNNDKTSVPTQTYEYMKTFIFEEVTFGDSVVYRKIFDNAAKNCLECLENFGISTEVQKRLRRYLKEESDEQN